MNTSVRNLIDDSALSYAVAQLKSDPGAIFNSPDAISLLQTYYQNESGLYVRWRSKIKEASAFPIALLDKEMRSDDDVELSAIDELVELGKKIRLFFMIMTAKATRMLNVMM